MCSLLDGYVSHIREILKIKDFTEEDYKEIGLNFAKVAKEHNMSIQTCFEDINLVEYGFRKKDCLDLNLAYKLTGKTNFKKWKARKENKCNCVEMVDIGYYNSCRHFCKYCYANYDVKKVGENFKNHNPSSSLLIGELKSDDIIKIRS